MKKGKPAPETAPEAFLQTLDGLGVGYYRSDASGTFVQINEAGAAMLGYASEEVAGRVTTFDTNVSADGREVLRRQAEAEGAVHSFVSPTRRKDGTVFYAEWSVRRRPGPGGGTSGYEGVFRDVSDQVAQVRRQQELLDRVGRANDHLQTFAHIQEDLLSALGHDLKTPAGIVIGFCELLLRGRYGEFKSEQERPLRAIHRNTAQLAEMLELLLDFSRFLKRLPPSAAEPRPVEPVLSRVLDRLSREARARRVRLSAPSLDGSALAAASPEVLEPLLEHLVRNAVLLAKEGREVGLRLEAGAGKSHLTVTIPEQQEEHPPVNRLLGGFYVLPLPPSGSTEHETYRLGLAAARYLVTLAHGQLTARSLGEEGVEIALALPASHS